MNKCIKCGSHAFNLYKEGIDQGGLCDVHYWQGRAHRAEALAEHPAPVQGWKLVPIEPTGVMKDCGASALPIGAGAWNAGDVYRAMLAAAPQPAPVQQEPVAWGMQNDGGQIYDCITPMEHLRIEGEYTVPLYASPPQRTWIGLTDEDIERGANSSWVDRQAFESAVWWAEAKLKEKNGL